MTDWLGIEIIGMFGGFMALGIIIITILERITIPNDKITGELSY